MIGARVKVVILTYVHMSRLRLTAYPIMRVSVFPEARWLGFHNSRPMEVTSLAFCTLRCLFSCITDSRCLPGVTLDWWYIRVRHLMENFYCRTRAALTSVVFTCKSPITASEFRMFSASGLRTVITQGRRLTFTVGYSKIKHGVQLWLYFIVFRKSDLWQDINDAILKYSQSRDL